MAVAFYVAAVLVPVVALLAFYGWGWLVGGFVASRHPDSFPPSQFSPFAMMSGFQTLAAAVLVLALFGAFLAALLGSATTDPDPESELPMWAFLTFGGWWLSAWLLLAPAMEAGMLLTLVRRAEHPSAIVRYVRDRRRSRAVWYWSPARAVVMRLISGRVVQIARARSQTCTTRSR